MTIDNDVKQLIKAGRLTDAGQAAYQAAVTGRAGTPGAPSTPGNGR